MPMAALPSAGSPAPRRPPTVAPAAAPPRRSPSGASILERHFTDHKNRIGPDIAVSMDKNELRELIAQSRQIALMRGGKKEVQPEELITTQFAYASVVAIDHIQEGESLTEKNLWVRRPGTGDFLADDYIHLLGKKAAKVISKGAQIKKIDIR